MLLTLEDGSVDVDENNGDESDDKKLKLPVVRVHKGQRGRDSKLHFDVKRLSCCTIIFFLLLTPE
jgi:hypothetical protein